MTQKIAVIDIGSNSVRLVVYDGLKRTPLPLFNEKVLCGLGRGLNASGKLNPEGVESALKAIARFTLLAENMEVGNTIVLATAAMRDGADGQDFAAKIKNKFGLDVKIISGEEEARLSCLGVQESIFEPQGIVGDLGGGSLELSYIDAVSLENNPETSGYKSFPLGPLRLKGKDKKDYKKAEETIDECLLSWPQRKAAMGKDFYAVGGSFRAIAKIHMETMKYPLKVLHNYSVPAKELEKTLNNLIKMSSSYLKQFPFISENRKETLGFAALIASRVIKLFEVRNMVFSVHGIREGYLFDRLTAKTKAEDPLISGCSDMIEHISTDSKGAWTKLGHELFHWMSPLFKDEKPHIAKLRLGACILSRLAWYEHTEYRAEMALRLILDSSLSGVSHADRVFIGAAVYHRYKSNFDNSSQMRPLSLIGNKQLVTAKTIGMATRVGLGLCGGAVGVLEHIPLDVEKTRLVISSPQKTGALIGESVQRRFFKLADNLNLKPEIKIHAA